jgi:hypothetical protein
MLKGKYKYDYPKQFKATSFAPARLGFVNCYAVSEGDVVGELEQFKAIQASKGVRFQDDETGEILFFSPDGSGDKVIDIRIGRNGSVTEVNEFRSQAQKAFIEAGKLGEAAVTATAAEYGRETIKSLFANRRKATMAPVVEPVIQTEPVKTVDKPIVETPVDGLSED